MKIVPLKESRPTNTTRATDVESGWTSVSIPSETTTLGVRGPPLTSASRDSNVVPLLIGLDVPVCSPTFQSCPLILRVVNEVRCSFRTFSLQEK